MEETFCVFFHQAVRISVTMKGFIEHTVNISTVIDPGGTTNRGVKARISEVDHDIKEPQSHM